MSQEEGFKAFQQSKLERHKRISVPNLALEMAERKIQQAMFNERDGSGATPWSADLPGLLDALVALGEARFSTAHDNRRDLFESAEQDLERIRGYILNNFQAKR